MGPLSFSFRLLSGSTLAYPTDYLKVSVGAASGGQSPFNLAVLPSAVVCLWSQTGQVNYQNTKTFRCEMATDGYLHIYVPEELQSISSSSEYSITITDTERSGALVAVSPSGRYYMVFETNVSNDRGLITVDIPPCHFRSSNKFGPAYTLADDPKKQDFYVDTSCNQVSKTLSTTALLNDPTWANVHFALSTAVNPIPTGDTGTVERSRIIIELSTHDEIRDSYDKDLGYGPEMSLLSKKQYEIGCGGYDHSDRTGSVLLLPASGHSRVTCTLIQAKGNSITQPVYVLIENYAAIPANTLFNFFLAKVGNPLAGTAHLLIRVQSIQPDGSWYDIYSHPVGYMGDTYQAAPNAGLGLKSLLNANSY